MELFVNIVDCIQPLTVFAKCSILGASQGRCASVKTKEKLGALSLISQKIRPAISADFFHFQIQFYLHIITLRWENIIAKFDTRLFDFKLIHPCNWIYMTLNSHHLPVQTHRNNYGLTLYNFFGECEEIKSDKINLPV